RTTIAQCARMGPDHRHLAGRAARDQHRSAWIGARHVVRPDLPVGSEAVMTRHLNLAVAVLAGAALVVAACRGATPSASPSASATPSPSAAPTAVPSPTPSPSPT